MRRDRVDAMHFISQYELRALIEELLDAPTDERRQEVTAAMRYWLRVHCSSCGNLIDHELRREGEQYCFICFPRFHPDDDPPPLPDAQRADDVPF